MILPQMLSQTALRFPNREALVYGDNRTNYLELDRGVRGVASFLRGKGLIRGERVALLTANTPAYVSAYYGILAAGGIVVPLNTANRAAELASQIRHCGATFLICDAQHPEVTGLCKHLEKIEVVSLDTKSAQWAGRGHFDFNAHQLKPSDPAAIIYTSGTTGLPKGVTLSHGNLVSNIRSILSYLKLNHEDSIVNVLPFYYSYGNSVLHTHLAVGAKLVLVENMNYPTSILELMADERASGFSGVPSTYSLLINRTCPWDHDLSLRYLTQAGGAMAPSLTKRVREAFHCADLFVMYGQTEATARLTYLPPEKLEEKLGSVGVAVPGVRIDIRDSKKNSLPFGEVGEIWVQGPNVMLGYWSDERRTSQIIRNGWLRTGDLGRFDEDGYLFIEGRRKDMIKSGAHRISPYEIEEVISQLGEVEEVAVIGIDEPVLGQAVKAVIVPKKGATLRAVDVQRQCWMKLAPYKVPKVIQFVERLPKTPSGKIQRYMLSEGERDVQLTAQ